MKVYVTCLCSVFVLGHSGWAQPAGASKKTGKPADNQTTSAGANIDSRILNFDADVIEGERTSPSIMVQMELQAPTLDTFVFKRNNFNDFHAIDRKRKPKYRGPKNQ